MKIYGFIFARQGSTGLKNKNIKKFINKPLVEHTFNFAKKSKIFTKIFVSTDSDRIKQIAKKNNITIINRPKKLSTKNSNEWDAWYHAIKDLHKKNDYFDIFVALPCTSPLRKKEDVVNSIKKLDKNVDIVLSATSSSKHPKFNMIKMNKKGYADIYQRNKENFFRRQDVDKIYNLIGTSYVCRPEYITSNNYLFDGKVKVNLIPEIRSSDIDNLLDFKIAEYLYKKINK